MIYGWVAQWGVLTLHHSGVLGSILKSCYCQCLVYVRVLFVTMGSLFMVVQKHAVGGLAMLNCPLSVNVCVWCPAMNALYSCVLFGVPRMGTVTLIRIKPVF